MGSTVFVQARVHSFALDNGRVGYVWAEEIYEKKEGPKRSNWCVMRIGYREQMIDRIFVLAQSIPGGMLHVKNASPRSFIAAMLAKLEEPLALENTQIRLANSARGFYDVIKDGIRADVQRLLSQAGRSDLARSISSDPANGGAAQIDLDLRRDLDLIVALQQQIGAWQIWGAHRTRPNGSSPGVVEHALPPHFRGAVDLTVSDTGLAGHGRLLHFTIDGGPPRLAPDYGLEKALIEHAGSREASEPGYYKELLGRWQKLQKQPLPVLSEGTVLEVDASQAPPWYQEAVLRVSEKVLGQASLGFAITLGEAREALSKASARDDGDSRWLPFELTGLLSRASQVQVFEPADAEQEDDSQLDRMNA